MRTRHDAAAGGRHTLPANVGWAAYGTCMGGTTTGGAAADDDHVDAAMDSTESAYRAVARGTGAVRMP